MNLNLGGIPNVSAWRALAVLVREAVGSTTYPAQLAVCAAVSALVVGANKEYQIRHCITQGTARALDVKPKANASDPG
ncbi:hypothetical protein RHS01_06433 [Rhizoctonia solani]|uniref:Uncharacterized protein n=1 Tax=Rhizoctonia solani TaxID=456999 RepID=A0A8H7I9P2_9AGAM|nr:hypothetical protein RHS01_06433 [Rhizoctonia solani]